MKRLPSFLKTQASKGFTPIKSGFTLIELLVVIAILGVLAVVLITVIDPIDKIRAANDTGVISTVMQLGKTNDSFAAQRSNSYTSGMGTACTTGGAGGGTVATSGNLFPGAVFDLCSAGEVKFSSITAPSTDYTFYYFVSNAAGSFTTCNNTSANCGNGQFGVGPLRSKKNLNQYFVYSNGKSCKTATLPTAANIPLCP